MVMFSGGYESQKNNPVQFRGDGHHHQAGIGMAVFLGAPHGQLPGIDQVLDGAEQGLVVHICLREESVGVPADQRLRTGSGIFKKMLQSG